MKQKKGVSQENTGKWKLLPLQCIVLLLPLLVKHYQGDSGYGVYPWNGMEGGYHDIFLHCKMVVFIILAAVMLVGVIWQLFYGKLKVKKSWYPFLIPAAVYVAGVLLSTIFSINHTSSLTGAMDQKEPVWVLLGYVITAVYAALVLDSLEDVKRLLSSAVIGAGIMTVIGLLQMMGQDPLVLDPVQRLFAGNEFIDTYGLFVLSFEKGHAYGTLYNPNYVGSYVALYVPFVLSGLVLFDKLWQKAACGITAAGLLVVLFASQSRTGLIAVVLTFAFGALCLAKKLVRRWYLVLPPVALVLILFFGINAYKDNLLLERLMEMVSIEKSTEGVQWIDTTGEGVQVGYGDTEFTVRMEIQSEEFSYDVWEGEVQKDVQYTDDRGYAFFTLSNGEELSIQTAVYEEQYAFGLLLDGMFYYFLDEGEGDYKCINSYGLLDECVHAENVFPGYETAASGRGYVWGRTIPLLKEHVIFGSGPDTFALEFPQNDYVARNKSGFVYTIFTRPHNFYLQMGIQTGILSLVAFLVCYGVYATGCFRRYFWKTLERPEEWAGLAVFLSTVGFMTAGLANDSLIVVSPVFYVLFGTGIVINALCPVKEKDAREKKG